MRLPAGLKLKGGFRLPRFTKKGRVEVPAGAFGQSNYQKIVHEMARLDTTRPDQPKAIIKNITAGEPNGS